MRRYEERCHSLYQSSSDLRSGGGLQICLINVSALVMGGTKIDITIGPVCDGAIAIAERNALEEVLSSLARRLGLRGESCILEVRLSISCALLTAVEMPG